MRDLQRVLCLIFLFSAFSMCWAQNNTVADYATNACYPALNIKAADLPATWDCRKGTLLNTFQNSVAIGDPAMPAANVAGANHLKACDAPAWLSVDKQAKGSQCYAATYLLELSDPKNEDFKGALFCRHKISDSKLPTDFDDVAMIFYNKKSGKTCWFQAPHAEKTTDVVKNDGTKVPRPDTDAGGFWLKPSQAAGVKCTMCHDNGPWMNSQWLYSQLPDFENDPDTPYITVPYAVPPAANIFSYMPPAAKFPTTADFVTTGKSKLLVDPALSDALQAVQKKTPTCTSCHNLSRGKGNGQPSLTYSLWFNYATSFPNGATNPPTSTIPQAATTISAKYDHTRWMPTSKSRPADAPTYDTVYKKHFMALMNCMAAAPAAPPAAKPKECESRELAFNTAPAPDGTVATVSATDVTNVPPGGVGGIPYLATVQPLGATLATPVSIQPGTLLALGWQADATFYACTTEATMPPGVMIPSFVGMSSPVMIGSGANWALPDTPPEVGPLTVPGIYDFSIYCANTLSASVQFQIAGTSPPLLTLTTLTNGLVQATAADSYSSSQPSTKTKVLVSDSVQLNWIAYNVGSDCTLSGPGVSGMGDVGVATAVMGTSDQVYTYTCTGTDNLKHSVSATLQPVISNVCNLNAQAIGKAGVPNNPGNIQLYWRDTSGDSNYPVDHYNIYTSQDPKFLQPTQLAGAAAYPQFAAAPRATTPGQTLQFTDLSALSGSVNYYQISPASASDTEYCSTPAIPILSASVPAGR